MDEIETLEQIKNDKLRREYLDDPHNWQTVIMNEKTGINAMRFSHYGIDVVRIDAQFRFSGPAHYDPEPRHEETIVYLKMNTDEKYLTFSHEVSKSELLFDLKMAAKKMKMEKYNAD